jgi:hypothetical protein
MTDDLRHFKVPEKTLYVRFWIGMALASFVVYLIPEQQGAVQTSKLGQRINVTAVQTLGDRVSAESAIVRPASAHYQSCPKLRSGKWLRWEVAQQTRQGWIVTCSYEGDGVYFARDEVRL